MNKRIIASSFFTALMCMCAIQLPAYAAEQATDECSSELLLAYFPEPFVKETLKKFQVSEEQWNLIQKDLAAKDKDVIKTVEQKASEMDPNPLKDPQSRQAAVKLFRETLLQVFTDVMKEHGISDDKQIQAMLDDIQQQKAQRFAKCIKKMEKSSSPLPHKEDQLQEKAPAQATPNPSD